MTFFHELTIGDFFVNTGVNVPVLIMMKTGSDLACPVRYCKRRKVAVFGKEAPIATHMSVQSVPKGSIT